MPGRCISTALTSTQAVTGTACQPECEPELSASVQFSAGILGGILYYY